MNHGFFRHLKTRLVVAMALALAAGFAGLQHEALVAAVNGPSALTMVATHDSTTFGYQLDLPDGWRRSDVLSEVITDDPRLLGHDLFTIRSASDEAALVAKNEWMGPVWQSTVIIMVQKNPGGLTAQQWATDSLLSGKRVGQTVQPLRFAGQDAVRVVGGSLFVEAIYVAYQSKMYMIGFIRDPSVQVNGADEPTLKQIVQTFRFK